jgi:hypothetical protein
VASGVTRSRGRFHGKRDKGAFGQAGALRLGGRRVRRLRCGARPGVAPSNSLRSPRSASFKQAPASQLLMRATRADPSAPLLAASEAHSDLPERAFAEPLVLFPWKTKYVPARGRRYPAGAISGAARSTGPGSARLRASTTDSRALSERSERSERSECYRATLDRAPQRSRRTRRPPRHEPLPGAACREPRRRLQSNKDFYSRWPSAGANDRAHDRDELDGEHGSA